MKKGVGLIIVAIITTLLLVFFTNPELLDKVWLWLIGFAGYILVLLENTYKSLTKAFGSKKKTDPAEPVFRDNEKMQSQVQAIEARILQIEKKLEHTQGFGKADTAPH